MATQGLFGPGSVTWRVHAEPVLWVGGLRALLLQAVHPVALAGVLGHSDYRADPWGRLLRTANYVGAVSFGSTASAQRQAARVRRIHRSVQGVDRRSGRPYRADDPHLLAWVHCCQVDSFLTVYQRSGGGLTAADADRYVTEQVVAATLLGMREEQVPHDVAGLADYFTRMRPELSVDERARRVLAFVMWPPMPARVTLASPARPVWLALAGLAVGLLPAWARRLYGLPAPPGVDLAVTAQLRALRAASRLVPAAVRDGPHLRGARARLAAAGALVNAGPRPAAVRPRAASPAGPRRPAAWRAVSGTRT